MTATAASMMAAFLGGLRWLMRWILKHPFLTLVVMLLAWRLHGEVMKAYWDWKIDRMCASEQMLQIFVSERIPPDPGRIGPMGPYVPLKDELSTGYNIDYRVGDIYYERWIREIVREESPRVTRYITEVVRASGGQVLARATYYGRSGGDFIAIDHPTSHGCGSEDGALYDVLFQKGD